MSITFCNDHESQQFVPGIRESIRSVSQLQATTHQLPTTHGHHPPQPPATHGHQPPQPPSLQMEASCLNGFWASHPGLYVLMCPYQGIWYRILIRKMLASKVLHHSTQPTIALNPSPNMDMISDRVRTGGPTSSLWPCVQAHTPQCRVWFLSHR